jgi:hypothetical protein
MSRQTGQAAASGDSGRDAQAARDPPPGGITDRAEGQGDSQRITRPGSIITIRRAKLCRRAGHKRRHIGGSCVTCFDYWRVRCG